MKIGHVKTISTFLGFVEITRTKKDEYKAEFQDCHNMAKATDEKTALETVLNGRFYALKTQTLSMI